MQKLYSLIFLIVTISSLPNSLVSGLDCHNCYGRSSDNIDDCVASTSETLLDKVPKTSGNLFSTESNNANVCLKMVTKVQGKTPDQNLYQVVRMGAHMRALATQQIEERQKTLEALNNQCTLEERESRAGHVSTQLCACTTDYCNTGNHMTLTLTPVISVISILSIYIM